MRTFSLWFRLLLALTGASEFNCSAGGQPRVVVVVWDGMRPDLVSAELTPTLVGLAAQGVTFLNHHPVYITSTEVNGTALATGMYPGQSGIVGNKEFRPALDPAREVKTEALAVVRRGDGQTGMHYLQSPTVAEILRGQGFRTAVAGAKPVALLHDRAERADTHRGATVFAGMTLPSSLAAEMIHNLGGFPPVTTLQVDRDLWTTKALSCCLWDPEVPPYSLLWLSEPDNAQHETGLGSPTSLAAIRAADSQLAFVLTQLERRGLRATTDVIVVSDHGFSTIAHSVELISVLRQNGFRAYKSLPATGASPGDIMVVSNGGTVFLYVIAQEPKSIERLAHFLQTQPFCGVLFTRRPIEGTFSLADARIAALTAPDIVLSLRWSSAANTNGIPGLIDCDYGEYGPGNGAHGSLSPYDLHNLCVAAGPHFRKGVRSQLPSGNVDIAPTVLAIFGISREPPFSGRVLREAFEGAVPAAQPATHRLETAYHGEGGVWRQFLRYSELEGVVYLEEGNGSLDPEAMAAGK